MTSNNKSDETGILSSDTAQSQEFLKQFLKEKQQVLAELDESASDMEKATLQLEVSEAMVGLGQVDEAWGLARMAFDAFLVNKEWEQAVRCCDVLYQTGQPASLVALGQGVWLAVTYPIDPQLSVNMLSYIIDETPAKADGAAVAAITAHYIADLRTEGKQHENLTFLTKEMVANVAKQHSGIEDQNAFSEWVLKLKLKEPEDFLPKLSLVLGAIVPVDQWWFDRDQLRSELPDN